MTCSEWQDLAYSVIRERRGNNAFSVLWLENEPLALLKEDNHETDFDFSRLFHPAFIDGYSYVSKINQIKADKQHGLAAAFMEENCQNNNVSKEIPGLKSSVPNMQKVDFILTYGNDNMESDVLLAGKHYRI